MNYLPPSKCPVCGGDMVVSRMTCPKCSSEISGSFATCKYCSLNEKMTLFLETFLKCRGSIKDVEKSLSISYPTVKSLLEELIVTLFPSEKAQQASETMSATEILDLLEKGEISTAEAAQLLAKLN